jgi:hypothetical protein
MNREGQPLPPSRGNAVGQPARIAEAPRPQWQGLFREPEWPPEDESE